MGAILYRWPSAAHVGTVAAKKKFYAQPHVTSAVQDRFVAEVERITWAYKLADSTVNLPGDDAVPEIEVFVLDAKGEDISDVALSTIDKAIRKPLLFEITRSADAGSVRMAAVPKHSGPGAPKLGTYYRSEWRPTDAERSPLPAAITLAGMYTALLESITGLAARPGEDVADVADRLETGRKLEREIATLERKLRTEPQFNRRVDLRRTLIGKRAELDDLNNPAPGTLPGPTS